MIYLEKNVLEASKERISMVFDEFENIYVSVSGGKDSTVLYQLALNEAVKRGRKINLFFLDQEVEYESTINLMRTMMSHPKVNPLWYQVPLYLTNATSYSNEFLCAWGEGEEWIRPKEDISIHSIDGDYPKRFYLFFDWFEQQQPEGSAFLIGIRAAESLNRFRAVTRNPGYKDIKWSTKTAKKNSFRFHSLYDWGTGDIWKYIDEHDVPYNTIYDKMFANNYSIYNTTMRVSNLVHEKSYSCLTDLQALEPETYEKVVKRLPSTHCAAKYAKEPTIYSSDKRPEAFKTWKEYRDYLLETAPISKQRKDRFVKRFDGQPQDEYTYRQQCKQVLINDWENNIPINIRKRKKVADKLARWREIL
jgi:predicted phosphoadenosine phosphosulfate sulfurtransferase